MKKNLLLVFAAVSMGSTFAQKIDWSTDAIIKPTEIRSSTTTGSTVTYQISMKNLGPDSAMVGDTVLFQIGIVNSSNQAIVVAPSASNFYFKVLNKKVRIGDTVSYSGSFTFGTYTYPSQYVKVIAVSHLINASRGIKFETATSIANNTKTSADITWFNPQGWPVSTKNANLAQTKVTPTLAQNEVTVSMNNFEVGSDVTISVVDITGRVLQSNSFAAGNNEYKINVADLSNGNYFVRITNGSKTSVEKIVVQK